MQPVKSNGVIFPVNQLTPNLHSELKRREQNMRS